MTIVGVVKNHKYRSIEEEPIPMAWYMYAQIPDHRQNASRNARPWRAAGDSAGCAQSGAANGSEPAPDRPMTQRAQYELTISQQLLFARLAGFFGLLAVFLVATGLYGTLAYRVNNRTAEIGVRMAVGARRRQVVWMVLRDSLMLTAIGVAIGVPLASVVANTLSSALYWRQALRWADLFSGDRGSGSGGAVAKYDSGAQGRECRSLRALRAE